MIVIFCSGYMGFPNGAAPTVRMISYGRGLTYLGKKVKILLLFPSDSPGKILNPHTSGEIDNISFEYTCGRVVRGNTFLQRRWIELKGIAVASYRLISMKKEIEAIILYPDHPLIGLLVGMLSKLLKIPLILEKGEHPFLGFGDSIVGRLKRWYYIKILYNLYDGAIVVSVYLYKLMKGLMSRTTEIIQVPILVDLNEFACRENTSDVSQVITYCGLLNEKKDGVLTLMRAYSQVREQFPKAILRLVGDSSLKSAVPEFKRHAEELGISDGVEFVGAVKHEEIPLYLHQATVLALARPSSLQADAGFPTKLGEYLASGKPVVVTRVGGLDHYLKDRVNVFFSPPDDVNAFAEQLIYVLGHPSYGLEVGLQGRKVAEDQFDINRNTQKIVDLIDCLKMKYQPKT
jgi:glycosyltransferase involved in cell wall biosynthesis